MLTLQSIINKKRTDNLSAQNSGVEGTDANILEAIHQKHVNVAVYNRDVSPLEKDIQAVLAHDFKFDLTVQLALNEMSLLYRDIQHLLNQFKVITQAKQFRLFLSTVSTNMCRKFHMDYNDLRLLCTYSGPGTLWVTEDNLNRKALDAYGCNERIVVDMDNIKQAQTGAVVVLKGAKYSKRSTNGAVHRSPTIEERGERRLLLRIDTHLALSS